MTTTACHGSGAPVEPTPGLVRIALVGSPNAGKTSVYNQLTGMRARTGNYPGVTVTRSVGTGRYKPDDGSPTVQFSIEDLPGAYSLHPISPDEQIVADVLQGKIAGIEPPDALAVVVDVTVLERSMSLVAQVLAIGKPTMVILTMTDELSARGGHIDIAAFSAALGVPAVGVVASRGRGFGAVRELMAAPQNWPTVPVAPPRDDDEFNAWITSVLDAAKYRVPEPDARSAKIDKLLLHPIFGTLIFFVVMFLFFQVIFTVAAPLQDLVETGIGWLGTQAGDAISNVTHNAMLSGLVANGIIGGVGAVLVFIPQIVLMFLLIAIMENVGYMSRAAFLVDRIMALTGLEGRAFVAMLSSVACAVPGIMATRTMPSSRDRIATSMAAPLMTCSARLPVYILLIGLLVDPASRVGPFSMQGTAMFGMYVLGGVSAMLAAWVFKSRVLGGELLPFYMEMPPYRFPAVKSVLFTLWDSTRAFLRRAGTIILATSIVLWFLLNLPTRTGEIAGMSEEDAASYVLDHSFGASLGRLLQPIFDPLGFDWRIVVGLIGAMAAREVFVSTMAQIFAADAEDPSAALQAATWPGGEHLFTAGTTVALLIFFAYALLCMSTVATIRRETNSWRWPIVAWSYMMVLAWVAAFVARHIALALTG
ncbi:ferrous iron transporter B [Mycolicibacterium insubricum]|jgi:ferrous iron transport protein B|uniref:Ferrous iron transporter B n=1 Tax=Mycolicibacterium insubricum TaxID=444597 RepID=A0A1X0D177_9MYCO|nr:ferrous iron transporter B [Mycolicibacterium insubricum]MCB9440421.1 ferrous iron transporter B [Mycolicibacterium sp.]MCV7082325.1 ferrous iron transporter B [Mycolicibacterium insubricum]ORA66085.1 ferrous iron transporter B [Mycolicibacterium insubricum]BBZ66142.1 ferrous iron transporter B [Mycolicibacterium insubricum]